MLKVPMQVVFTFTGQAEEDVLKQCGITIDLLNSDPVKKATVIQTIKNEFMEEMQFETEGVAVDCLSIDLEVVGN